MKDEQQLQLLDEQQTCRNYGSIQPPSIPVWLRARERIPTHIFNNEAANKYVAGEIAAVIRQRQEEGRRCVLGLATGSTPLGVYQELIRLHKSIENPLSFRNVITFNLDEYYGIDPGKLQSYHRFMHENLFDHVDVSPEATHLPPGMLDKSEIAAFCEEYERRIEEAGGIDLQLLGIGHAGHIGFNEQGTKEDSKTRLGTLSPSTRRSNASEFFSHDHVPHQALTLGISAILSAKRIILVAFGETKAAAVVAAVEGNRGSDCPASFLQGHPHAQVVLDAGAGAHLTRVRSPWSIGQDQIDWSTNLRDLKKESRMEQQAVIWLSKRVNRPILRLTADDYLENGLGGLLAAHSNDFCPDPLNAKILNALQSKIRPSSTAVEGKEHKKKQVILVFSPHPDDDVISMGGTLRLLCSLGHEVHVAYQTTGCIAVRDEDVLQRLQFCEELLLETAGGVNVEQPPSTIDHIKKSIQNKQPGDADSVAVQRVKSILRRTEAVSAAAGKCGVPTANLHFLNLPFYNTSRIVKAFVFYIICLKIILEALGSKILKTPRLLLYRGAWQEWGLHEADLIFNLTPDEIERKLEAIKQHQSQKDPPPFPGVDVREFWVRARERNRATAAEMAGVGLTAAEGAEMFVEATLTWKGHDKDTYEWSVLGGSMVLE